MTNTNDNVTRYRRELEKRLAETIKKMPDSQLIELQARLREAMEKF